MIIPPLTELTCILANPVNHCFTPNIMPDFLGKNPFMCRLMGTFINMDKMVGDNFMKGLSDLKTRVENDRP